MSSPPLKTTFTPRGRLNGVFRHRSPREQGTSRSEVAPSSATAGDATDLDTQAYEALYYRARLILGDAVPRPARP